MKAWGYGEGYQHAHQFEDAMNTMECLPESLRGSVFYEPLDRGGEQRIAEMGDSGAAGGGSDDMSDSGVLTTPMLMGLKRQFNRVSAS